MIGDGYEGWKCLYRGGFGVVVSGQRSVVRYED